MLTRVCAKGGRKGLSGAEEVIEGQLIPLPSNVTHVAREVVVAIEDNASDTRALREQMLSRRRWRQFGG
jgi:hypothetical protein